MSKSDLAEIKKSRDFLSDKFDDLAKSIQELKRENKDLRSLNLVKRVNDLEIKVTNNAERSSDDLQTYLGRDLLEIRGIRVSRDDNTNKIVLEVAMLINSEHILGLKLEITKCIIKCNMCHYHETH